MADQLLDQHVHTAASAGEAAFLVSALHTAGIRAVVEGAAAFLMSPVDAPRRLLVTKSDRDRAREVIERALSERRATPEEADPRLESGAGGSPPPSSPSSAAVSADLPPLSRPITVFCAAVTALALVWMGYQQLTASRDRSIDFLTRGRYWSTVLDASATEEARPSWLRAWDRLWPVPEGWPLVQAIDDYSRDRARETAPGEAWILAVLHAEAGQFELIQPALRRTPLTTPESWPGIASMIRFAYGQPGAEPARYDDWAEAIDVLREECAWAGDRLAIRLAERAAAPAWADAARARIRARGERVHTVDAAFESVNILVLVIGLALFALWRAWGFSVVIGDGISKPPWTWQEGGAVLARGVTVSVLLGMSLPLLACLWPWLSGGLSLVANLPLIVVGLGLLLAPRGLGLLSAFGLRTSLAPLSRLAVFALGVAGAELGGRMAILSACAWLGLPTGWEDGLGGHVAVMPGWEFGLVALDTVVWAPLCEEIVFRGFLYVTLRSAWRPLPAAIGCALLFAMAHGYSVSGFASLVWSGLVWSVAYERSRSLWPGIMGHSFVNLSWATYLVAVYRS